MAERQLVETVRTITTDKDYASQLSAIISELGLSAEDGAKYFKTLDSTILDTDLPFLKALGEISRYEGFNPREMIRILLNSHERTKQDILADENAKESFNLEVVIGDENVKIPFSNDMSFHSDMQFLCLMFITRGAAFDKIMKKSNNLMKDCMSLMKIKYNINVSKRRPGQSLEAKVVTIPRIAASFPAITVGLFHKGFGRSIFDPQLLFGDSIIPRAMLSPMITSVLPKSEEAPLAVFLAIAVKTDDILHQMEPTKTSLSAIHQYLLASYNSTAVTELLKMKYCESWGLGKRVNAAFLYSQEIKDLKQRSKDFVRSSRINDPALNTVLGSM